MSKKPTKIRALTALMATLQCCGTTKSFNHLSTETSSSGNIVARYSASEYTLTRADLDRLEVLLDCIHPINTVGPFTVIMDSSQDRFYDYVNADYLTPVLAEPYVEEKIRAITIRSLNAIAISPAPQWQPQPLGGLLAHEYIHLANLGDDGHTDPIWEEEKELVRSCNAQLDQEAE